MPFVIASIDNAAVPFSKRHCGVANPRPINEPTHQPSIFSAVGVYSESQVSRRGLQDAFQAPPWFVSAQPAGDAPVVQTALHAA